MLLKLLQRARGKNLLQPHVQIQVGANSKFGHTHLMDSAGPSNKAPEAAKPSEGKKGMEQLSLPFTQVKRIVASHLAADTKISINKEATLAFSGERASH